jgi:hypothetical protein
MPGSLTATTDNEAYHNNITRSGNDMIIVGSGT